MLTADVRKGGNGPPLVLTPGQALTRDDAVALNVDLDRDAYVYVVHVDANGDIVDLFPRTGDTIMRHGSQRLPPRARWKLDASKGPESFVVLAAARPLDRATRLSRARPWKQASSGARTRSALPKQTIKQVTRPAPPEVSDVMGHGDTRAPTEIADGIVAEPDAAGVTTAVFVIDHR